MPNNDVDKSVLPGLRDTAKFFVRLLPLARQFVEAWVDDPKPVCDGVARWASSQGALLKETGKQVLGQTPTTIIKPERHDRRFKHPSWKQKAFFNFIHQSFLLSEQQFAQAIKETENMPAMARIQAEEWLHESMNFLSPDHFILTNPEIIDLTLQSKGQNLIKGFEFFKQDLAKWQGYYNLTKSDESYYRLGENLAKTPGKVVFENELMQLLHYQPVAEQVIPQPILITPSFINKYYILDLTEKSSLVRWLLTQGFDVYLISWVNPTRAYADYGVFDYVNIGVITAMKWIASMHDQQAIHLFGHCVGGFLNSVVASHFVQTNQAQAIASMSYMTTRLNFSIPNKITRLISCTEGVDLLDYIRETMMDAGIWDGREMAVFFNLQNGQEYYWSYFVSRYLRGNDLKPNPMLYWLQDVMHIAPKLFSCYLRRDNIVDKKQHSSVDGVSLEYAQHAWPTFALGIENDQLDLWQSVYLTGQLFSPHSFFVLAQGDHVGGMNNPPTRCKYGYWVNETDFSAHVTPEEWLDNAQFTKGSWWPVYANWLKQHSDAPVSVEHTAYAKEPDIEPAPGRYVKQTIFNI
jgi:polyhydroxyalkanoate synthase